MRVVGSELSHVPERICGAGHVAALADVGIGGGMVGIGDNVGHVGAWPIHAGELPERGAQRKRRQGRIPL